MRFFELISFSKFKFFIIIFIIMMKEIGFSVHIFGYRFIFEFLTEQKPIFNLGLSLILLLVPVCFFIIFTFLKGWIFSHLESDIRNKLSDIIISKVQNSQYSELKFNKNSMISWFNYDLKMGLESIGNLLKIITPIISLISGIVLTIILSPKWGWILILTTLILSLFLLFLQQKINNFASKPVMNLSKQSEIISQNNLGLLNSFKSFYFHNKIGKFKELFLNSYKKYSEDQIKEYKKLTKLDITLTILFNLSTIIILIELTFLTLYNFYSLTIFLSLLLYSNRFNTDIGNILLSNFWFKQSSSLLDKILKKTMNLSKK
ncbi:hypothetical protein [Mesomycoplasma dispar]|uniref:hypothetical protein n=1 Tax=Mesomycoplasma dispar TaxID=86660 RepID=UPI001E60CF79|nr:hypothetical protein [Mesomycoplasma dispar]